jgi:6-phosphogluconolactonase (cycloisomerase 2 family)
MRSALTTHQRISSHVPSHRAECAAVLATNSSPRLRQPFPFHCLHGDLDMKGYALVLGLLASGLALPASAQRNFLYINNDASSNNTVSAYSVNHAGIPTELPGSPFATGGSGTTGPAIQFNPPQITTAKHFLYASNDFDSNIAAFEIEHDGTLETVAGSPFAAGTVENCAGSASVVCEGIPLAATPHGKYLFAGHPGASTMFPGSSEIYGYRIGHDGALVPVPGSPFNSGGPNPSFLKVTPDGHTLLALLETPTGTTNQIAVFRIGEHGVLTQVPGSPFSTGNHAAAFDISCNGEVYVAEVDQIEILKLASNGQLTAAPSSPVFPRTSGAVGDIQLTRFQKHLFETNFFVDEISAFDVRPHTVGLAEEPSSPTAAGGSGFASKLALNARGNLLYATVTASGEFAVLGIGPDAALTPLTAQHTGQPQDGINTLTAYPRAMSPCKVRDDHHHHDDDDD